MSRTCSQCQSPILETQRFCRYCGHRLGEGLQDYVETQMYGPPPLQPTHLTEPISLYPSWSPTAAPETTPLVVKRCSRTRHRLLVLVLLGAMGGGIYWIHTMRMLVAEVVEQSPPDIPEVGLEIMPEPLAAPGPPLDAPPMASPPQAPGHPSGNEIQQQISKMLREQAALTQQEIEWLRRRLERDGAISNEQREALLEKIRVLQEEQPGILAAAEALQSEALQNLAPGIVLTEEVLKSVEAELKRHQIQVDLSHLDDHPNQP